MEQPHKNEAWLLGTVQGGGSNVEFWASLEVNFFKKNLHLRG